MEWWKEKVIYQVYPRSFADSNGDGIGDLKGITNKLDYLKDLGIGGIWLSPHYPSPFLDCGYDIADYCGIGSEYGKMDDFKKFLQEAHNRDIRVILDLVLNHTSDQHPWFKESSSSVDSPKRDWYVWKENNGNYPNDWQSCFKGSAWTLDKKTDEYYYHFFLKEQPDLNWRNPEVKEAMFNSMRFWLDMGIDGFRIDAITSIFEDEDLTNQGMTPEEFSAMIDKPEEADFLQHENWEHYMRYQIKQPELHGLIKELRDLTNSYGSDKFLVGELPDLEYLGNGTDQLHMVFNFPLMDSGIKKDSVIENQNRRLPLHPTGSWQGNTLSNHDQSRIRSKYANDDINSNSIRQAAFLMFTLKGTPFIYYGEEIGMKNHSPETIENFMDMKSVNLYHEEIKSGKSHEDSLSTARIDTRDRCRTPMPWDATSNGGFTPNGVKPWLPLDPEYRDGVNVADELMDKNSILNYYKNIINFRNNSPVLQLGDYEEIKYNDKDLLIFKRVYKKQIYEVIINYSKHSKKITHDSDKVINLIFGKPEEYSNSIISAGSSIILEII